MTVPTDYVAAIDEMFNRAKTGVASVAAVVGIATPWVRYFGRDAETVPPASKFGVEVSQVTATSRQTAFGVAARRYTTTGTLYIKVFAPQAGANGYEIGRRWADGIKNTFRSGQTTAKVWYRNARVQELLPEKGAYRFNVAIDYIYDELN